MGTKHSKRINLVLDDLHMLATLEAQARTHLAELATMRANIIGWALRENIPHTQIATALGITTGRVSQLTKTKQVIHSHTHPDASKASHKLLKARRAPSKLFPSPR